MCRLRYTRKDHKERGKSHSRAGCVSVAPAADATADETHVAELRSKKKGKLVLLPAIERPLRNEPFCVAPTKAPSTRTWAWQREELKACGHKFDTIGMFDSGVGGLTVYMELRRRFPQSNVIYFADMRRQPYGPRTQAQVAGFCHEILSFMKRQGCGVGVIACNTATAATFDFGVNENPFFSDFPIFGTIPFAAMAALAADDQHPAKKGMRVGVLATQGTCRSGAYARALADRAESEALDGAASPVSVMCECPEFMSIAEQGTVLAPHTRKVAEEYMAPLRSICAGGDGKVDALIYGCTHYPILKEVVEDVLFRSFGYDAGSIRLVNPAVALVDKLGELVAPPSGGTEEERGRGSVRFCVNADPEGFAERASKILGHDVSVSTELVDLQA